MYKQTGKCVQSIEALFFFILGIHLECPPASYGRNCLQTCSKNCYISTTCDRETGVCIRGCLEGWNPPMCNERTCTLFKTLTICHSDFQIVFINYQFNR